MVAIRSAIEEATGTVAVAVEVVVLGTGTEVGKEGTARTIGEVPAGTVEEVLRASGTAKGVTRNRLEVSEEPKALVGRHTVVSFGSWVELEARFMNDEHRNLVEAS